MKNFLLLIFAIALIGACSKNTTSESKPEDENSSLIAKHEIIDSLIYVYDGEEYMIEFILENDELVPITTSKAYLKIEGIMNDSNSAVFIDSATSKRYLFNNESDMNKFIEENSNLFKSEQMIDPGDGWGGGGGGSGSGGSTTQTHDLMLYIHGTYGGAVQGLNYSSPNLDVYGFHDEVSSLKIRPLPTGQKVILWEDINYGGKRIIIEPNGYQINIACLCDYKIGSSGPHTIYITGGAGVDPGSICGFACNSWNDEVSSIQFIK
ncbi:hypothetical protein ACW6QP_14545 [Salegentibacter sp. HM20]